jgi:ribonucleoside-diphosphate reductase alpha chain
MGAIELLEAVKLTQLNWVTGGRDATRCVDPRLNHNVSNTINVKPDEWEAVTKFIYENRHSFAGVSLLPHSGDKDYPQAPFCQVFTPEELVSMYGDAALFGSGLVVDGLHAFGGNLWKACDAALGIGEVLDVSRLRAAIVQHPKQWAAEGLATESPDRLMMAYLRHSVTDFEPKVDWVRRCKQFADRYLAGDVRKATYALKDISNYHRWVQLKREYVPVDWTLFKEDSDATLSPMLDPACAGGKCQVL